MQLYRCDWLSDLQRTNISCALNAMQEKSLIIGLSDMPLIRGIETLPNENISQSNSSFGTSHANLRRQSSTLMDQSNETSTSNNSNNPAVKTLHFDSKHDTRIVNEAFQVIKKFKLKLSIENIANNLFSVI